MRNVLLIFYEGFLFFSLVHAAQPPGQPWCSLPSSSVWWPPGYRPWSYRPSSCWWPRGYRPPQPACRPGWAVPSRQTVVRRTALEETVSTARRRSPPAGPPVAIRSVVHCSQYTCISLFRRVLLLGYQVGPTPPALLSLVGRPYITLQMKRL